MFGNLRHVPPEFFGVVLLGLWFAALALVLLYLIGRIIGAWVGLF